MAHFRDRPRDREGRKEGRKEEDTNKVCGGGGGDGGRGIISIAPARDSKDSLAIHSISNPSVHPRPCPCRKLQGSPKECFPGCEKALGKLRQKW